MQITMHVSLKSLFVTGLLALSTQSVQAEWQAVPGNLPIPSIPSSMPSSMPNSMPSNLPIPNNMPQAPWIAPDMMPITWGDCVPVPVAPTMPMGFGSAPAANIPMPFPAAPPSPFYGNIPVIPLPPVAQPQCAQAPDDGSKDKLSALQTRYKQASEASRNKIEELKQILNDTQNQLQDSVASVGSLTQAKESSKASIDAIKNKMVALSQTSQQMLSLKEKENTALKKHLATLDKAGNGIKQKMMALGKEKDSLQKQLALATERSGQQAQKIMAFGQSTNSLKALKQQLVSMTKTNDGMQLQLQSLLKKSASDISSIQTAHDNQAKENTALKKQLAELNAANKNMRVQIGALKTDATDKSKQLLSFKQSSSQLASLQQANQSKATENDALKKKLAELTIAYNSLQAQNETLNAGVDNQNKTILGLKESSNKKLGLLQQAFNTQEANTGNLKSQLALCANAKTELDSCKASIDQNSKKLVESTDNAARLKEELEQLKIKLAAQAKDNKNSLMLSSKALNEVKSNLAKATADKDKDGVLDKDDKCPSSPFGSHVNAEGCPKVVAVVTPPAPASTDADNDGVADGSDLCPTSEAGATVNEFGCKADQNITLEGVTFRLGSVKLKNSSLPILDAAANSIKSNPNLKIQIEGHTDNQGWTGANKRLSQRRANTVMIYLIRKGVKAENLSAKGYGESQPVTTNDTTAGRAKNRRVDLKILK